MSAPRIGWRFFLAFHVLSAARGVAAEELRGSTTDENASGVLAQETQETRPPLEAILGEFMQAQSANPKFYFLFNPDTTRNITVTVVRHSLGNKEYTEWELDVEMPEETGWSGGYSFSGSSGRSMSGTVYSGDAMEEKLQELNSTGVMLKETFAPLFDGPRTPEERMAYLEHIKSWFSYRLAGMKNEAVPGKGQLDAYAKHCIDDACELAEAGTKSQTRIIGYSYAVRAMKGMVGQIACHNGFRRNELGSNILNPRFWQDIPSESILLGSPWYTHAFVRPWTVRLLGTEVANQQATLDLIKTHAHEFMDPAGFDISTVGWFGTKVLHKLHFNMEITDKEAKDFASKQTSILVDVMLPRSIDGVGHAMRNGEWKKEKMAVYMTAMAAWLPEEWETMTVTQQKVLVSGLMDSLLFAGGLSVPTVLQQALGVLYGFWGRGQLGDDFELTTENLDVFVQEVLRRFPAVGAFPFWDRETNAHNQIDLRAANLGNYSEGWGEDALSFRLRTMEEYEAKAISWANFAMLNDDPSDPGSRVCPGRVLSINMVRGFLSEFLRLGGTRCWEANLQPHEIWVNAGSTTKFTLKVRDGCAL